jgi:hypothetical protein
MRHERSLYTTVYGAVYDRISDKYPADKKVVAAKKITDTLWELSYDCHSTLESVSIEEDFYTIASDVLNL